LRYTGQWPYRDDIQCFSDIYNPEFLILQRSLEHFRLPNRNRGQMGPSSGSNSATTPISLPKSIQNTSSSASPFHLVVLPRGLDLVPRPLAAHRQAHRVPPATVRAHVAQPLDVVLHDAPRVVLDRHRRQLGGQRRHDLGRQRADFGLRLYAVLG